MSRDATDQFGPFADIFGSPQSEHGHYLPLLWARGRAVVTGLRLIREAVGTPDWPVHAVELLRHPNWRCHLVGGGALLFQPQTEVLDALWSAFDVGSWVSPQLAVIAFHADGSFIERAQTRIENRCPVTPPGGLTALERHVLTGPSGTPGRAAKNLASLAALCERIPALAGWLEEIRSETDIRELLRRDAAADHAAEIVLRWMENLQRCFAGAGWPLRPAFE